MSDRVTDYHAYIGELEARIEVLEAALNDIIIRADDYDEAEAIARAALAPETEK